LNADDAADVLQEVWHAVHRGILDFRPRSENGSLRSWLKTITRNKIRDFFRQRTRHPPAVGGSEFTSRMAEIPDCASDASSPHSPAGPERGGGILAVALENVAVEFEVRTWEAFWRTTIDGMSPADVAIDLQMSLGAVHTARWRVLKRLRQYFDRFA
jgi:RNA polymerase sigma-70 factor (ECF subfamily)